MAQTGKYRSLTVKVTKTVAGIVQAGYPRIYNGLLEFGSFGPIDSERLSIMSLEDYQSRLSAFKTWVQNQEPGLEIDATCTVQPYY